MPRPPTSWLLLQLVSPLAPLFAILQCNEQAYRVLLAVDDKFCTWPPVLSRSCFISLQSLALRQLRLCLNAAVALSKTVLYRRGSDLFAGIPFVILNTCASTLTFYGLCGLRYEWRAILIAMSLLTLHTLISQQFAIWSVWFTRSQVSHAGSPQNANETDSEAQSRK